VQPEGSSSIVKTRRSGIKIKYNDSGVLYVLSDYIESFSWVDNANGEADTAKISMDNINDMWTKDNMPERNDFFTCWIKVSNWMYEGDTRKGYCGKFQVDQFDGGGETVSLSGISVPINKSFNTTMRDITYKKTTLQTIMKKVASRSKMKLVYDAPKINIKEIKQSKETDLNFAFNLCSQYGIGVKVYNGKLVIYEKKRYEKRAAAYTIKKKELIGEDPEYEKLMTQDYTGVKYEYTNSKGKKISYSYNIKKKKGKRILLVSGSSSTYAEAKRKAKAALEEKLREVCTFSIQLMGDPKYLAAENIQLKGFGKLNGKYFIEKASHEIGENGYITTLTCHKCVTNV
jgi:hypothetical protein